MVGPKLDVTAEGKFMELPSEEFIDPTFLDISQKNVQVWTKGGKKIRKSVKRYAQKCVCKMKIAGKRFKVLK